MWYNPITEWLMKSPLHRILSGNTMIIKYTGRKSGQAYHVPVGYQRSNGTLLTVSYKKRHWWRNLRGGAEVTILLKGKMVPARAQAIEDDQGVAEGLKEFIGDNLQAAHMFKVKIDADGCPEPESLRQAVKEHVIVKTFLE